MFKTPVEGPLDFSQLASRSDYVGGGTEFMDGSVYRPSQGATGALRVAKHSRQIAVLGLAEAQSFRQKGSFFSGGGILFGGQRLHGGVEIVRGARSLAKA